MTALAPLNTWLQDQGFSTFVIDAANFSVGLLLLLILAAILSLLARRLLVPWLEGLVVRTHLVWDDTLAHAGFFKRVGQLVPLLGCYLALDLLFAGLPTSYQYWTLICRFALRATLRLNDKVI